jgi:hypothetical protein
MLYMVSLSVTVVPGGKNGHILIEAGEVGRSASAPAALHAIFPKTV